MLWTVETVEAEINRLCHRVSGRFEYTAMLCDFVTVCNLLGFSILTIEFNGAEDVIYVNKRWKFSMQLIEDRTNWPRFIREIRKQEATP